VSVPVSPGNFETPRVYTTVRPPPTDEDRGRRRSLDRGRFTHSGFLDVEFDAKLRLADQLVIEGRQNATGGGGGTSTGWSHRALADDVTSGDVTTGGAWSRRASIDDVIISGDVTSGNDVIGGGGAEVHELSDGVYVVSVEFDEPFAYSTSSWVRGTKCARTFKSQFHPVTLATQDRTLIDHGLQNGGLFTFFVYINSRKYCNKGFDRKLTRKLLYCESMTKLRN